MPDFHVAFRDAVNLRHGTDGFTSPPKEGVLWIFFALKNPTASAGFEPANLGTKGQHATSRPPKPLCLTLQNTKQSLPPPSLLRNLIVNGVYFLRPCAASNCGIKFVLMKKLHYQSQIFTQHSRNTTKKCAQDRIITSLSLK
jgi:hypothetical protein